jgi:hypothetical protein
MTHATASAGIASEIETLRLNLDKVNAAIPVIGKAAAAKAKEIADDIEKAQERYAQALTDEVAAARCERMSLFSDISITYPDDPDRPLLRMNFTVRYTKLAYDMRTRLAAPAVYTVQGIFGLPDDAYEYLMMVKPEAIPPQIMALSPGDPHEAMGRYFIGCKRGYIRD